MSWHRRYVEIFFKPWALINCVVYAWHLSLLLNWLNFFTTSTGWPLVNFRYFVIPLYPPRFKLGFFSLLMVTENMTYITCFTSIGFLPLGQLPSHCNYANYVIHNGCKICPLFGARYQGLNHGFMTSVWKTCWGLGYEVAFILACFSQTFTDAFANRQLVRFECQFDQLSTCASRSFVPKAFTSLPHWRNESLIKAFVPTREFCNSIGLKFLLRRQGYIRSKRSRNEFEFCDDAITQFEHSRFFTSLFLFCLHMQDKLDHK